MVSKGPLPELPNAGDVAGLSDVGDKVSGVTGDGLTDAVRVSKRGVTGDGEGDTEGARGGRDGRDRWWRVCSIVRRMD